MFVHVCTTLPIKILVSHVEFHLYFIKIKLKKFRSTYTVHIPNTYISFTESITEVNVLLNSIKAMGEMTHEQNDLRAKQLT